MNAGSIARLTALAALWGASFVFIRVAVPALGPVAQSGIAIPAVLLCRAICDGLDRGHPQRGQSFFRRAGRAFWLGEPLVLVPALPIAAVPGLPTPLVAANLTALALASTAIAYLLYFRLIADIGPARALTVTFLIPLFGVLWGAVFLGENLAANMLAGCALILAGTWLALRRVALRTHPAHAADQGSA